MIAEHNWLFVLRLMCSPPPLLLFVCKKKRKMFTLICQFIMISPGFGIEVVLVARGRWIHFIFCVHDFPFRCECTSALQCFLILCQKYLLYPVKQRRQKKNLVFSLPIVTFVKILKSRTIRPASILIFDCYLFFISLISFSIFILCWFP